MAENFAETYHKASITSEGKIYTAAGDGRKPFISARDIAAVAYRALIDEKSHDTDHLITGGESLSYDDVSSQSFRPKSHANIPQVTSILSEVLGKKVEHVKLSRDKFEEFLVGVGADRYIAGFLADLDIQVAGGYGAEPTDVVQKVTGRPPRAFRDFAVDNKAVWS